jgi:hypothetical protein
MAAQDPMSGITRTQVAKVVTNRILRDEHTERRIQEMRREELLYLMLAIGGALMLFSIIY